MTPSPHTHMTPNIIEYNMGELDTSNNSSIYNRKIVIEKSYQLKMSSEPYDNVIQVEIPTRVNRATLGLNL